MRGLRYGVSVCIVLVWASLAFAVDYIVTLSDKEVAILVEFVGLDADKQKKELEKAIQKYLQKEKGKKTQIDVDAAKERLLKLAPADQERLLTEITNTPLPQVP